MKSVSTLADRVGNGAKGGAAATGITAASETLRTVAAVTNALTNTAGVTASIGFSKSKSTTASQESAVVGSTIAGGTVNVTATASDINVRGSSVTSSGDTTLTAARDVILEAAQNQIDSQFKSKSSGASLGVTVGVAVVGGVTASASVGVNASKSSGTSTETSQTNSTVTAGGTLALTTGRDAILKGAVAQGQNVVATIGRDLSVTSVADTSSRNSTSAGFSAGLTLAPGAGLGGNGSVNVGKGSGSSSIVSEQTALIAREGLLNATVKGNTDIQGGVIAALDADGKDTGRLSLTTGTLTASDIKDAARSKDVSVGISASINNVTDKAKRSANLPTIDGSFASSTFKQDTKATIGQGVLNVGVPDANVTINRDVDAAQVVTKDKATGFTVYADVAAAKELVSFVKGLAGNNTAAANSVILQGVNNLANDPLRIVKDVAGEIKSLSDGERKSGALELLVDKIDTLIPGFTKREAPRLTVDFISKLPDVLPDGTVVTAEQKAQTVAAIASVGGFEAAAEVERQFTGIGRDLNLDPAQTKELRTKTEAFIAAGDNSPEAKAKFEAELETIIVIGCRRPCAVSDINDPKIKSLFGAVVVATEKVGGAFNNASPFTQKLIGYGLTALGGVKGVVEEVVLSVAPQGIQDAIGKAGEAITVGADALLRTESFGTIASQNENKSGNNPTFNQTTGIGLATSIVAIGGVAKAVGGKGGGGADAPDARIKEPIQVGEVTSQREFLRRSVVGDNISGDHIPSAAALIAAKEKELGRKLTPDERAEIKLDGTVVALPADVHAQSRTFRGRNTPGQIKQDAADLLNGVCKDIACMAANLIAKGHKKADIDRIIADIKSKPILPPKPPAPPKPPKKPK